MTATSWPIETPSHTSTEALRQDIRAKLGPGESAGCVEIALEGGSIAGARELGQALVALREEGVRVTYDITITLAFPEPVDGAKVDAILSKMAVPEGGRIRVRLEGPE